MLSLSLLSDDSDEDEDASVPCRLIAGDPFSTQIVTAAQVFTALGFLLQLIGGLLAALPGLTGEASRPGWNEVMILFSPTGEKVQFQQTPSKLLVTGELKVFDTTFITAFLKYPRMQFYCQI